MEPDSAPPDPERAQDGDATSSEESAGFTVEFGTLRHPESADSKLEVKTPSTPKSAGGQGTRAGPSPPWRAGAGGGVAGRKLEKACGPFLLYRAGWDLDLGVYTLGAWAGEDASGEIALPGACFAAADDEIANFGGLGALNAFDEDGAVRARFVCFPPPGASPRDAPPPCPTLAEIAVAPDASFFDYYVQDGALWLFERVPDPSGRKAEMRVRWAPLGGVGAESAMSFRGEPYSPATRGDLSFAFDGRYFTLCRAGELSRWRAESDGSGGLSATKLLEAKIGGFYPFPSSGPAPLRLCHDGWIHVEQSSWAFGPTLRHYFFPPDLSAPRVAPAAAFAPSAICRTAGGAVRVAAFKAQAPWGGAQTFVDTEGLLEIEDADMTSEMADKKAALAPLVRIRDLPAE